MNFDTERLKEQTPAGADKVSAYKWTQWDQPGTFMMIDKNALFVDDTFQREWVKSKSAEFTSKWSWMACGAIIVGRRSDGALSVIDGQHRVLGALPRSDISKLPCLVFDVPSVSVEAAGFLRVNTNRKPLTGEQKFKAQVVSNDPIAAVVEGYIEEFGYRVGHNVSARSVKCVRLLCTLAQMDKDVLEWVFYAFAEGLDHAHMNEMIVRGLFWLHRRQFIDLSEKRTIQTLRKVGSEKLLEGITRAVQYHGSRSETVLCEGITNVLNKGMRIKVSTYGQSSEKSA